MIKLIGKTQRGKNIVNRDGAFWNVLNQKTSVIAFDGAAGMSIEPANGSPLDQFLKARWVRLEHDIDFDFEFSHGERNGNASDGPD